MSIRKAREALYDLLRSPAENTDEDQRRFANLVEALAREVARAEIERWEDNALHEAMRVSPETSSAGVGDEEAAIYDAQTCAPEDLAAPKVWRDKHIEKASRDGAAYFEFSRSASLLRLKAWRSRPPTPAQPAPAGGGEATEGVFLDGTVWSAQPAPAAEGGESAERAVDDTGDYVPHTLSEIDRSRHVLREALRTATASIRELEGERDDIKSKWDAAEEECAEVGSALAALRDRITSIRKGVERARQEVLDISAVRGGVLLASEFAGLHSTLYVLQNEIDALLPDPAPDHQ